MARHVERKSVLQSRGDSSLEPSFSLKTRGFRCFQGVFLPRGFEKRQRSQYVLNFGVNMAWSCFELVEAIPRQERKPTRPLGFCLWSRVRKKVEVRHLFYVFVALLPNGLPIRGIVSLLVPHIHISGTACNWNWPAVHMDEDTLNSHWKYLPFKKLDSQMVNKELPGFKPGSTTN